MFVYNTVSLSEAITILNCTNERNTVVSRAKAPARASVYLMEYRNRPCKTPVFETVNCLYIFAVVSLYTGALHDR